MPRLLASVLVCGALLAAGTASAQEFDVIRSGYGSRTDTFDVYPYGSGGPVSADGRFVVGGFLPSGNPEHVFRWSADGGFEDLGAVAAFTYVEPGAVSDDGSVVVGYAAGSVPDAAFRWTEAGGIELIANGLHPDPSAITRAYDVSADGTVIVGSAVDADGQLEAFRWTEAAGMVGLGSLPGGDAWSVAYAVSSDGSTIVGQSGSANAGTNTGRGEAFVWTAATGMLPLGDLAGGAFDSMALGISADGQVIVGSGRNADGLEEAVVWDGGGPPTGLGYVPGVTRCYTVSLFSRALAVSADGQRIAGASCDYSANIRATLWTPDIGMRFVFPALVSMNADLEDTTGLWWASGISDDGQTLAGRAQTRGLGGQRAYRLRLPRCRDGYDNDGDGTVDQDGAAAFGLLPPLEEDPNCGGVPIGSPPLDSEAPDCGLGGEFALVVLGLVGARRRRRKAARRGTCLGPSGRV